VCVKISKVYKFDNCYIFKDRDLLFDSSDEPQQEENSNQNIKEKIANQGKNILHVLKIILA
jgi:hypothetical protein